MAREPSLLRRIAKPGSFGKSAALLMGTTVVGQGLTVLAMPILSRLYTPEEFGVLAVYASLVMLIVSVGSLRYDAALPLPVKEGDAINLLALSLVILVGATALTVGVFALLPTAAYVRMGSAALASYWGLLGVGVFVTGLYQVFSSWALRTRDYPTLARTKVVQGVFMVVAQVGLGWLHGGVIGLLIGDIVGRSGGTTSLARPLLQRRYTRLLSIPRIRAMARRYRRFPLYSSSASLLNTLGLQLPSLLMAFLYGPVEAGLFALATRIGTLPVDVIGNSVAQVYAGQAAEAMRTGRGGDVYGLTRKVITKMGMLSLLFMGASLIAPWVFGPLFGEVWRTAGWYTFVLSLSVIGRLVVKPISQITTLAEQQHWQLIGDAVRAVAVFGSLYVPFRLGFSALWAIASYSVVMLVTYVMFLALYVSIARTLGASSSPTRP